MFFIIFPPIIGWMTGIPDVIEMFLRIMVEKLVFSVLWRILSRKFFGFYPISFLTSWISV